MINSRFELETKVRKLGLSFSYNQASTGSEYIKVNGYSYRISDHYQPSTYEVRNYTDVNSYNEVLDIVLELQNKVIEKEIIEKDGKKYEVTYCDEDDAFIYNEIN